MAGTAGSAELDCLLARLAAGDQDALAAIVDRHARPAWSLALRVCHDARFAEDVVQEVFLALWRDPTRYDPRQASFRTWLLTLVHHKSVDLVRREDARRRRREQPAALPASGVEETALSAVEGRQVRGALQRLPEQQRQVLVLAYYGGYTPTGDRPAHRRAVGYREVPHIQPASND